MLEKYQEVCASLPHVKPRSQLLELFAESEQIGAMPRDITLLGHSKELFGSRIVAADIAAMVDALCARPDSVAMSLFAIDMSCNDIGDLGVVQLARLLAPDSPVPLRSLNIRSNNIEAEGCFELCEILKQNSTLQCLNLRGNRIGNDGGMSVAKMLHVNESIRTIVLDDTEIGADVVIALATVLNSSRSVRVLSIANPRIVSLQNESTFALGKMLRCTECLHTLSLSKMQLGDDGAHILAENLEENRSLRVLDLRCSKIGEVGAVELAGMILQGSQLNSLLLGGNGRIGDRGAEAISRMLQNSKYLETLDLANCGISDGGLSALAEGVSTNATLARLYLWGNTFGESASALFLQLFEGRFKYYELITDFRPYVVDDQCLIAKLDVPAFEVAAQDQDDERTVFD